MLYAFDEDFLGELIEVEELEGIEDRDGFLFKYDILEANTAVKPYLLERLPPQATYLMAVAHDQHQLVLEEARDL